MDKNESLEKAIDAKIDAFFAAETEESTPAPAAAEEAVEKAADVMTDLIGKPKQSSLMKDGSDAGPAQTKADEVKAAKPKDEKEGENGRPKEVQDVPNTDEDGSRAKGYDHIQAANSKTPETSPKGTFVKSDKIEVSKEDYELLQKAKKAQQEEELRKARQEQTDLIKSAVKEATKSITDENAALKKSLEETQALVKAFAKKPQAQKSISSVQALEKSFDQTGGQPVQKSFSKSEMLDVAEELVKSKQLTVEQAIELEDTGYIFDPSARGVFEAAMRKRG